MGKTSRKMKSIFVILLAALILSGCKEEEEKWGCDSEPYKTVNNVEANFIYGQGFKNLGEGDATICNIEIVPEEILLMSEEAGWDGIDVIISGDLHKGRPPQSFEETPSYITLTEIKLPEK
jgi:hypothetical protein